MIKIRSITFEKHPILGNLHLNFCREDGAVADTVIFAGENGSGKSTILNELFKVASHKVTAPTKIEIEKDGVPEKISFSWEASGSNNFFYLRSSTGYKHVYPTDEVRARYPFYGIFSDVDINFNANPISSVTSLTLDSQVNSRRSTNDLPSKTKQLLIDIQALDDSDISHAVRDNPGVPYQTMGIAERMPRFTRAFSTMFDNMAYSHIENIDNHKEIFFVKYGKKVPIDALSSGEKQVVYRGCFLLKDVNAMNGAFVFIDEPEISLHPTWQMKIMDYYKGIFTNEDGVQTSQIFAVTHSPFVIHNDNRRNDKVIVLARDEQGNIIVIDKPEYYKCDSVVAVHDAFSIDFTLDDKPTVYLEGKTDEMYFKKALEVYGINAPFQFKGVGYMDGKTEQFSGSGNLKNAKNFLIARNKPVISVCLFDCDTKLSEEVKNNVFTRVIPEYSNPWKMNKGIENALVLNGIDLEQFYECSTKDGDYGKTIITKELIKMKMCKYICAIDDQAKLQEVFANLKTVIDRLMKIFET